VLYFHIPRLGSIRLFRGGVKKHQVTGHTSNRSLNLFLGLFLFIGRICCLLLPLFLGFGLLLEPLFALPLAFLYFSSGAGEFGLCLLASTQPAEFPSPISPRADDLVGQYKSSQANRADRNTRKGKMGAKPDKDGRIAPPCCIHRLIQVCLQCSCPSIPQSMYEQTYDHDTYSKMGHRQDSERVLSRMLAKEACLPLRYVMIIVFYILHATHAYKGGMLASYMR